MAMPKYKYSEYNAVEDAFEKSVLLKISGADLLTVVKPSEPYRHPLLHPNNKAPLVFPPRNGGLGQDTGKLIWQVIAVQDTEDPIGKFPVKGGLLKLHDICNPSGLSLDGQQ